MPNPFVIQKSPLLYECSEFAPQQFDLMRQTAHMFTLNRIQDQLKTEMSVIRPIPKLNHSQPTYLEPFQKLQMSQHHTDDMFQSHALAAAAAAAAAAATANSSKIPTAIPVSRESAFTPIPQKNHVVTPNNAAAAAAAAAAATFCFNNCQTCVPRTAGGLNEMHRLPHYLDSLLMQSCEPFLGGHRNGLLAAAAAAAAAVDPSASCFSYGLTEQCFTISPHLSHHSPKLSAHLKDEDNKLSLANSLISAQFQHRYQPTSLTITKNPSSLALAGLAGQASRSWTENNIISFLNLPPPLISNSGSGGGSSIGVGRNGTGDTTAANQAAAAAALLAKEFRQTTNHPPRYQCEACKKSYATFGGLSKHKQFHCITQVKREFSCKFCSKSYASLGALKMHIRTHTLPCRCKLCGKAFSRPWLLQGHIRTHTGEKPFKCPHCGRAFADRSNLRAHLQTHSDVKKYGCKTCNKTFSRMSLLLKHEDSSCPGIRC